MRERRSAGVVAQSLGVGVATGAYGISFGALATTSGLTVLQACALSFLVFTGATQFAFLGVVASGGNPITGAAAAVLLGSRNMFYGLSLVERLRVTGWRRLLTAHVVIDESTAIAVAHEGEEARRGFYWTGISIFVLWNLTTALGAVAGTAIGDPRDLGLDAAVGAAFLGLLWPRLTAWHARGIALLAVAVALGLVPLTPAGVPIILGGAVAVAAGAVVRPRETI